MSKNLPLGAENDPRAPWNEKERGTEELNLEVYIISTKDITIEVPKEASTQEIRDVLKTLFKDDFKKIRWNIVEIDWED